MRLVRWEALEQRSRRRVLETMRSMRRILATGDSHGPWRVATKCTYVDAGRVLGSGSGQLTCLGVERRAFLRDPQTRRGYCV